ncbi:unnamed protein product [Brassicogethes aeneus]|uniref:PSP proline-rich domain-containing protein n=1 Tax=Brassicogethes aeneus TaxID=1431903 RepID=A0A9P0FIW0_BRAAE|nr:unnamed protein product [Brassicogethes aeneus]
METRQRKKRKSPSNDIIFEVCDNDMSSGNSSNDEGEPEPKISKMVEKEAQNTSSNLEKISERILSAKNACKEEKMEGCEDRNSAIPNEDGVLEESVVDIIENADSILSMEEGELNEAVLLEKTVLLENDETVLVENEKTQILDESKNENNVANVNDCDTAINEMTETISITFSNKNISDLYKDKFIQFIKNFVEFDVQSDDLSIQISKDQFLNPSEWVVLDESLCKENKDISVVDLVTPVKKHKKKNKSKKNLDLFILDTTPSEEDSAVQMKYNSKFLIDANGGEKEEEKLSNVTCFNCGGGHSLRDCNIPKDFAKINAAKKKYMQPKNARYHLEDDQRFGHIVPGQISDSLRHALGLNKNQVPHYVYYMRFLGYPPGWLEEAKFVHSNLDMFDIDGKNVQNKKSAKTGLDPDKIVEYVGFNAPFEKGFKDEYRKFNTPPYSAECSKQAMLDYFEKECVKDNDNLNSTDMDLDESERDEEEEEEEAKNAQENETLPVNESLVNKSLNTLEEQKIKLLEELNNSMEETEESRSEKVETPPLVVKTVLDTSYGTPILKSSSPYVRLPNADNFSKDVSPVINFENLPNSTGKYEQMTGVIQKVRTTLKTLQSS